MDGTGGAAQAAGLSREVLVALAATALVALAIAIGALMPSAGPLLPSDKLAHAAAFSALALPMAIARPRWIVLLLIGACAYGVLIELVQPAVSRDGDLRDLLANAAGAFGGAAAGAAIVKVSLVRRAIGRLRQS